MGERLADDVIRDLIENQVDDMGDIDKDSAADLRFLWGLKTGLDLALNGLNPVSMPSGRMIEFRIRTAEEIQIEEQGGSCSI